MSRYELFPYPSEPRGLEVTCELRSEHLERDGDLRISAVGLPEDESVVLELSVHTVDEEMLQRVLAPAEIADPPVEMVVAVQGYACRTRRKISLVATDDGKSWVGNASFKKGELYGSVSLSPMLVRAETGSDPNFALHLGAILAKGESLVVDVDEAPTTAGGALRFEFEDFATSSNPQRLAAKETMFAVAFDHESPVVWVNEGIPELRNTILSRATKGIQRNITDATDSALFGVVWSALISASLSALVSELERAEELDGESDPFRLLLPWQQSVVQLWASKIFGNKSARDAVGELTAELQDPMAALWVFQRLVTELQGLAPTRKAFEGLVRLKYEEGS